MNDLGQDVEYVEQKTENVVEKILNWQPWEVITHLAVAALFIYIIYLFVVYPEQRSLTNWLLLLIALAVDVQIHQNINIQLKLQKQ